MEEKINSVIEKVKESSTINHENKEAIMIKLEEWKKEDQAISDVTNHFEQFWLDMEPIFAEMGWI